VALLNLLGSNDERVDAESLKLRPRRMEREQRTKVALHPVADNNVKAIDSKRAQISQPDADARAINTARIKAQTRRRHVSADEDTAVSSNQRCRFEGVDLELKRTRSARRKQNAANRRAVRS